MDLIGSAATEKKKVKADGLNQNMLRTLQRAFPSGGLHDGYFHSWLQQGAGLTEEESELVLEAYRAVIDGNAPKAPAAAAVVDGSLETWCRRVVSELHRDLNSGGTLREWAELPPELRRADKLKCVLPATPTTLAEHLSSLAKQFAELTLPDGWDPLRYAACAVITRKGQISVVNDHTRGQIIRKRGYAPN